MTRQARIIAFYLPQYHPIPENDQWWGKGFTEWTNVAKAKPIFPGHDQPRIPADLGFYDLRVPAMRLAQAEMARTHGVEAFCYWHYWFAGRRVLERPFEEVLKSGDPDFPFCLGWANETWSGIWHGCPERILIQQTYPGVEDYRAHFRALLPAFLDSRYLKVVGRPLFYVFKPHNLPDARQFTDIWREMALKAGLPGLYLVGHSPEPWNPHEWGFDAVEDSALPILIEKRRWFRPLKRLRWEWKTLRRRPTIYRYADVCDAFVEKIVNPPHVTRHACILPGWDNTPRSGVNGLVLHGSTPELFRRQVRKAVQQVAGKPLEHRIIFLKSWNEWAEGNYMEPDTRFGYGYLKALKDEILRSHAELQTGAQQIPATDAPPRLLDVEGGRA